MKEEKQEHIIGNAIMDNRYGFTVADEAIYNFLGVNIVPLFTAYIHPEDRERFIEAVEDCDRISDRYVTVKLKNFTGQYCLTIIFITPSDIHSDKFFQLNIYDVVHLVHEYNVLEGAYKKIAYTMQLMKPAICFDYTFKTGHIVVFGDRDVISFDGNIDDLYKLVVDNEIIDRMHISGLHKLFEDIKRGSAGVCSTLNMRILTGSNKPAPVSVRTAPIYDKGSASPVSVVGVITSEETNSVSTDMIYNNRSNLDPLTGLYNKAAIREIATDALSNTNDVINYVMLDLDHFKEVNDTYGHMFGDEVILNAARIIKDIVGRKGYVGRVGGDEFFIVLKGIGSELDDLRPILRSIRAQIEWAYKGRLGGIKLTTSIGCASYPKDADNYDDLFKLADRCLYCAKTKGRNRFIVYVKEMHGSLEEIKATDNSIKMERTVSDNQRLEFVTDAVSRLNDWKRSIINSVLKDMLAYFGLDEVAVYDLSTGKAIYSAEPIDENEDDNICNYFNSFKPVFRESNVFTYGESLNLKVPYPEFYEYVCKKEYFSLFVYSIKEKGEITHLVAAYTKGKYVKWSDMAINCLCILFKTIGDKILNS